MLISIICPFYNEKENLKELHERLLKTVALLPGSWEILFVNDGSRDGGTELLKSINHHPSVYLIDLDRNYGLTTALAAGFQVAKGDVLVTLDADLQNHPEEIPRLIQLLENYDMVTGIRRKRQDSLVRRVSSKIARSIRQWVIKDHIQDVGCTLRVFRKGVLECFYPYVGMHRFFAALAERQGFRVRQVPVEHASRRHGKAKYGLKNRLWGPLRDLFALSWILQRKIDFKIQRISHG